LTGMAGPAWADEKKGDDKKDDTPRQGERDGRDREARADRDREDRDRRDREDRDRRDRDDRDRRDREEREDREKREREVEICHLGKREIDVSKSAVAAHLAHGDTLGECDASPDDD